LNLESEMRSGARSANKGGVRRRGGALGSERHGAAAWVQVQSPMSNDYCCGGCYTFSGSSTLQPRGAMSEVTRILTAIDQGDAHAAEQLLPLVYDEMRKLAAEKLGREKPGQTLQATALVHEAYLRLVGPDSTRSFKDGSHFLAVAATAMRRILTDNARRKLTQKRGGSLDRHELDGLAAPEPDTELLALDEALERLAIVEPVKARLVELRYFAGLTSDQAAEILGISPTTADRHWAYARAWLQAEVRGN
jgi:RNA polymerase sigma factor (TIGR02999 family)